MGESERERGRGRGQPQQDHDTGSATAQPRDLAATAVGYPPFPQPAATLFPLESQLQQLTLVGRLDAALGDSDMKPKVRRRGRVGSRWK